MEKEKFVKVPIKEYVQLKNDALELASLESAGVDNWCGFDECESYEEYTEKDITNEII
jgi:hypothetical protein